VTGGLTVSYPEPRYAGENGLANATFRPTDRPPDLTQPSGGTVRHLATGESTRGQFGLYRWEMTAAQSGPNPHFHRTISESFYVLTGTIQLYAGSGWVDGTPGDFLFVPEGGIPRLPQRVW
jgi:mannose-6-phosphate isomerase-like protein (cupin superfamily)